MRRARIDEMGLCYLLLILLLAFTFIFLYIESKKTNESEGRILKQEYGIVLAKDTTTPEFGQLLVKKLGDNETISVNGGWWLAEGVPYDVSKYIKEGDIVGVVFMNDSKWYLYQQWYLENRGRIEGRVSDD